MCQLLVLSKFDVINLQCHHPSVLKSEMNVQFSLLNRGASEWSLEPSQTKTNHTLQSAIFHCILFTILTCPWHSAGENDLKWTPKGGDRV